MPTEEVLKIEPYDESRSERLSEDRLYDLVAAFGNHEGKGLLLGAMEAGRAYSARELHELFLDIQGSDPVFVGSMTNQKDYCHTFETFGLARSEITPDGHIAYSLTDEGIQAKPLAGLLLHRVSASSPYSLLEVFGDTEQRKTPDRPPKRTVRTIEAVLTEPDTLAKRNILKDSGYHPVGQGQILQRLSKAGLIGYDARRVHDEVSFAVNDLEELQRLEPRTDLTKKLAELVNRNPEEELTYDSLKRQLGIITDKDSMALRSILHHWQKLGIIKRSKGRGSSEFSQIHLSDEQRVFWENLLNDLYNFQAGDSDTLREGQAYLDEILADEEEVKSLVSRGYSKVALTKANYMDRDEKIEVVESVLSQEAQYLNDIEAAVNSVLEDRGKRIGGRVLSGLLKDMRANGKAVSHKGSGRALKWTLVSKN